MVFIGSISSQGNRGQISYASTKAGLEGAAATIMKEAMFHGVRCSVIHPGFTDTPMVRAMGADYVNKNILPFTQLGRLIKPDEIADAICFMLANAAVSGELGSTPGGTRRREPAPCLRAGVVQRSVSDRVTRAGARATARGRSRRGGLRAPRALAR